MIPSARSCRLALLVRLTAPRSSRLAISWLTLAGLLLVTPLSQAAESLHLLIVSSQHSGPYAEVTQALTDALARTNPNIDVHQFAWDEPGVLQKPADIVVAVGGEAVEAVAANGPKVPTLNLLVPKRVHEHLAARYRHADGSRYSAVYLDQPLLRQVNLIQLALPQRKSIGILLGPDSRAVLAELDTLCADHGLNLIAAPAHDQTDLADALRKLTADADVLLALPDPTLLNATSARNILLFAYRANMPVVGFSPAYAKAGAMLSLYSTPRQMGEQGATAIEQWARGRGLPAAQHAREFEVEINSAVARSLGFSLEPAAVLANKLRQVPR